MTLDGRNDPLDEAIVDAALNMIAADGLAALTLRPLAARIGVSVSAVSARMGTKEMLVERLIAAAAACDQAFRDNWQALSTIVAPRSAAARATIADQAFDAWLSDARRTAIFLIELIHSRALRPFPSPTLDNWLENFGAFWSDLIFGTTELSAVACGYMLDETAFALSAKHSTHYALLRRFCLQRLADGLLAPGEADGEEIVALVNALRPQAEAVLPDHSPKRSRIAEAAAQVMLVGGIEAATHRAVALAAGVPAPTVVYHYGGRDALVVAGLNAILARFHALRDRTIPRELSTAESSESRDLVKITSLIALASSREPSLVPYALDMRRRRGENIRLSALAGFGLRDLGGRRFDRAAAQVLSIALFGMRMVAIGRGLPERDHYQRGLAALERWNHAKRMATVT